MQETEMPNQTSKADVKKIVKETKKDKNNRIRKPKKNNKNNKKINKGNKMSKIKDCKPEHYFILVTGVPLKNIKELALALQTMDEWVFNHHVNEHRNDFSNWIKDIFNEDALAEELKELKTIKETELKLLRYLVSKYL